MQRDGDGRRAPHHAGAIIRRSVTPLAVSWVEPVKPTPRRAAAVAVTAPKIAIGGSSTAMPAAASKAKIARTERPRMARKASPAAAPAGPATVAPDQPDTGQRDQRDGEREIERVDGARRETEVRHGCRQPAAGDGADDLAEPQHREEASDGDEEAAGSPTWQAGTWTRVRGSRRQGRRRSGRATTSRDRGWRCGPASAGRSRPRTHRWRRSRRDSRGQQGRQTVRRRSPPGRATGRWRASARPTSSVTRSVARACLIPSAVSR